MGAEVQAVTEEMVAVVNSTLPPPPSSDSLYKTSLSMEEFMDQQFYFRAEATDAGNLKSRSNVARIFFTDTSPSGLTSGGVTAGVIVAIFFGAFAATTLI